MDNGGSEVSRMDDLISRKGVSAWLDHMGHSDLANAVMNEKRFPSKLGTNLAEVGIREVIGYPIDADALMEKVAEEYGERARDRLYQIIRYMPPAQPETATVTIGRTKGSVTAWYECDACGEPVDQKDNYCRNCGRRLKYD